MAHNFLLDVHRLHTTAWSYWQAVDETAGWGFILGDLHGGTFTRRSADRRCCTW